MLDKRGHLFQGEETPVGSSCLQCSPPALPALEALRGTVSQATLTSLSVAERTAGSFTLNFTAFTAYSSHTLSQHEIAHAPLGQEEGHDARAADHLES